MAAPRELDGKVVAVIGATGGLGRPICEVLRGRGATVFAVNRSGSTDEMEVDLAVDIRRADAGSEIVDQVVAAHGRLDGVVIAAGIVAFGDVTDCDDITVEELFLVNSMAPLWIANRVGDALAETQGFLVNVSAVVADQPMPQMAAYSASKAAAAVGYEALRKEWRRRNVAVIDARPPHTETGLADHPLAGTAPKLPEGLAPSAVAERIVRGIEEGDDTLTADRFG